MIPPELSSRKVKQVIAGHQISIALTEGGDLRVGQPNLISIPVPKDKQGTFTKVVANTTLAAAITGNNELVILSSRETPFSYILPRSKAASAMSTSPNARRRGYHRRPDLRLGR